jgi:hypothetical protein
MASVKRLRSARVYSSLTEGHATAYYPLFVFNPFGDLEQYAPPPGKMHGADGWRDTPEPVLSRARRSPLLPRRYRSCQAERGGRGAGSIHLLFPWLRHLLADGAYARPKLHDALAKYSASSCTPYTAHGTSVRWNRCGSRTQCPA